MNKFYFLLMPLIIINFLAVAVQQEVSTDKACESPCISLSLRGLLKGHSGWVTKLPTIKENEELSSEEAYDQFLTGTRLQKKIQVKYLQSYLLIDEENRGRTLNRDYSKKNRNSRSSSPKLEKRSPSPRRSGMENSGY
ncbi:hypothetical protein HYX58_03865 [Candidatus Dependentiae bacterium]|nr:hypothetical protein [Candidatus Dependentiae bacterium]